MPGLLEVSSVSPRLSYLSCCVSCLVSSSPSRAFWVRQPRHRGHHTHTHTHTTAVVLRLANVRFSLLLVCFSSVFPLLSSVDESARPCLHIVIAPTCCHTNVVLTLFLNLTVTLILPPARLPPFRVSLHRNCISRCHTVYIHTHHIPSQSNSRARKRLRCSCRSPHTHNVISGLRARVHVRIRRLRSVS